MMAQSGTEQGVRKMSSPDEFYSLDKYADEEVTLKEWVRDRKNNCLRIAESKTGADRDGWLEDASYFQQILDILGIR